eukprot:4738455-Prymnesium_polylepis.1
MRCDSTYLVFSAASGVSGSVASRERSALNYFAERGKPAATVAQDTHADMARLNYQDSAQRVLWLVA